MTKSSRDELLKTFRDHFRSIQNLVNAEWSRKLPLDDVDVEEIAPTARDVLLVVHVHDEPTRQIAIRLEPRQIDFLVEVLGGCADAERSE